MSDTNDACQITCVLIPRFNMLSLNGLLEPLRVANYLSSDPKYTHSFHAFDGEKITASNGFEVSCNPCPETLPRDALVFIFGSWGGEHYNNPNLTSWIRKQARHGARVCAVELGSFLFAKAGLLAGKHSTTHWSYLPAFQEQFPKTEAVEHLYTQDGNLMTCAGGTATIDLMLSLISNDHGDQFAGEISDIILHHPIRPGKSPQRLTHGRGTEQLPAAVRAAIEIVENNISEPLRVPEIADQVGISQRQLERQFHQTMGCSVVQFGLLIRLQHARVLLISTEMGVREIATASGFNSLSHFAYAFRKCFARRPSEYRQSWPEQDAAPQWPGTLATYLSHRQSGL